MRGTEEERRGPGKKNGDQEKAEESEMRFWGNDAEK
jgi:hypothetical protein